MGEAFHHKRTRNKRTSEGTSKGNQTVQVKPLVGELAKTEHADKANVAVRGNYSSTLRDPA
jgi:hypothetical protein